MSKRSGSSEIVTFAPCYGHGNRGFYNSSFYYDDMYIDFQLGLIEKFSILTQYYFIIKCLKTAPFPQMSEVIKDWISSKKYSNISYNHSKLIDSLMVSKKAVVDYPSSAIMQCEIARVSSLVLYYDGLEIRETAQTALRYVQLKRFKGVNDGIKIVEDFLLGN